MPDDAPITIDRGTYDLLRERLRAQGQKLAERLERLNAERKAVFGSVEPELLTTERVSTEHNCVPRDIVAVGRMLVFGYNVKFGLKAERDIADVFAVYAFEDGRFHPRPLHLLNDGRFEKDFKEVYRYYKDAAFEKFYRNDPLVYMRWKTGKGELNVKAFKWIADGETLQYVDSRSEAEVRPPAQFEFDWKRPRREDHIQGAHPHINIADKIFVETIGGDLTVKIENNTASGQGIYAEPVENADQVLDDAEIHYAIVGPLVLLKIKPYQEQEYRHLVYSEKTRRAYRLEGIADCCRLLPAEQGIIYPSGYLKHTGDGINFETVPAGATFESRIDAPNGEDFLYVFYDRHEGLYILLRYNLIAQATDAPLLCHGFTLFEGGELACFRATPDPQRHHAVQIWRTPFSKEATLPTAEANHDLFKIGNREIVRGMGECREILTLLDKDDTFAGLYADVARRAGDLLDSYYWIKSPATLRLDEPLEQVRAAAAAAVEEYEKVAQARADATARTEAQAKKIGDAVAAAKRRRFESVEEFTETLAELRTLRGETIGLHEVRHTDAAQLDRLETTLKDEAAQIASRCIHFLDRPQALTSFDKALEAERQKLPEINTALAARSADERVAKTAADLELLIETVSNLPIEDATQRTRVIDAISAVFATVNSVRAEVRNRRQSLARAEGEAEFGSQLRLLSQAIVNALDRCDTPEKCDEQFPKLLLTIEELEGRFAEFDQFAVMLAEKREEVAAAFETRKLALVEARAKRAASLASAADRLLGGIESRSKTLDTADAIHGYFAGDLTVQKARDLADQLVALGDAVRADGVLTRLKTARDDAVRQLKDKHDLFAEGPNVINLGGYRFSVNTQPLGLTTLARDGELLLHLTGTHYFEPLHQPELTAARAVWGQEFLSETADVYRGEYLAYSLFEMERQTGGEAGLQRLAALEEAALTAWVAERMGPRYAEGYLKGVHDRDGAAILRGLLQTHQNLGPLRTPPLARAIARLFWQHLGAARARQRLTMRLGGLRELAAVWPEQIDTASFRTDVAAALAAAFSRQVRAPGAETVEQAAAFLTNELLKGDALAVSAAAVQSAQAFRTDLERHEASPRFSRALEARQDDVVARWNVAGNWLTASGVATKQPQWQGVVDEAAVLLLEEQPALAVNGTADWELSGLLGEHSRIRDGHSHYNYYMFMKRLKRHVQEVVPAFGQFNVLKQSVLAEAKRELRVEEFKPRVLSSFVRNRLIDTAYLPLVGTNLAKQIGVAGEQTRADRQGMLLLVSPPGYGKTTLMEYIANRLGLVFLKVNGPAIGHHVTSLDPAAAPNLAAREELKKLTLGFEMGDNLMIYLDDIQHCNPEFLQKFISLCDAQRKIEGVWRGEAKTYDLRGRKVAVVMAGNPYTESGDKFQIPDMLANRADVYNLGDVVGTHHAAFELSFLENALTSNPVLSRLAGRESDAVGIVHLAQGRDPASVTLQGGYAAGELNEMVGVMQKLIHVRDVILKVNQEYIRSAAQADEFRTEPSFKLQGSYRNMNRIAERVLPAMNDEELAELIWTSFKNDAQTLTTGAEANLIKFRELTGTLSEADAARWDEIKKIFRKGQQLRGVDQGDRFGQAVAQLSLFADGLTSLRETLEAGIGELAHAQAAPPDEQVALRLEAMRAGLESLAGAVTVGLTRIAERPAAAVSTPVAAEPQIIEADADAAEPTLPSRITVVNKVPSTLVNVVREQFRLMEDWLRPVLSASQRQSEETAALGRQIERCLADYERLVGRLNSARRDGSRGEDIRSGS